MCITVSQHTGTHTHTTYTSLLHQQPLQQRAPALHRDLDSREILFVHVGVTITTPVPRIWQIKMVLNVRTTHPSPSLNKATIKSWNFFVFLLFSCANPGRCADCKASFQSLPSPHQCGVITRRRRRRDRVCRRTRGSTGWGAGWADTTLAGTSWTRKTLYGKMWGKTKALPWKHYSKRWQLHSLFLLEQGRLSPQRAQRILVRCCWGICPAKCRMCTV